MMSNEIHYKTFEEYFYESEAKNRKLQSRIKELEDAYTILDDCYKDQEKTIEKLESAVSEFGEGLQFYASMRSWKSNGMPSGGGNKINIQVAKEDHDCSFALATIGGKKAREIINKHKDLIESIKGEICIE